VCPAANKQSQETQEVTVANRLLDGLCVLVTRMRVVYGSEFKAELLRRLVSVARTLAPVPHIDLATAMYLLSLLPRETLNRDGALHRECAAWLTPNTRVAQPAAELSPADLLAMG